MTRQDVIARAIEDPEFRERLKSDPRGTIAREFGEQIPDDVEITVLEETSRHAYIVLPAQTSELSGPQLDAVAGGRETLDGPTGESW